MYLPPGLTCGYPEKLPFRPISTPQENKKCAYMTIILRFLITLFLNLERKFSGFKAPLQEIYFHESILNKNANFTRPPPIRAIM